MSGSLRQGVSRIAWAAAVACLAASCDRYGPIIDVDGHRPEKVEGTVHVSWVMVRQPGFEHITCADARARHVMVVLNDGSPRTYRMACDLTPPEAWLPVKKGINGVRAEAIDFREQKISKTPEAALNVNTPTEELTLPLVFSIN